jgi:hypothetical protein
MQFKRDNVFFPQRAGGVIRLFGKVSEKNVSAAYAWLWPVAKVFPVNKALVICSAPVPEISCLMLHQPGKY